MTSRGGRPILISGPPRPTSGSGRWRDTSSRVDLTALYSLALFVGAALLFALEPMVGKFLLPPLGATPSVWKTTVLFFQATLLLGYLYSHLVRRKSVHVLVLGVGAVSLPIAVASNLTSSSHPVLWLLGLLVITAGLPFFALAANGPLL